MFKEFQEVLKWKRGLLGGVAERMQEDMKEREQLHVLRKAFELDFNAPFLTKWKHGNPQSSTGTAIYRFQHRISLLLQTM